MWDMSIALESLSEVACEASSEEGRKSVAEAGYSRLPARCFLGDNRPEQTSPFKQKG